MLLNASNATETVILEYLAITNTQWPAKQKTAGLDTIFSKNAGRCENGTLMKGTCLFRKNRDKSLV